MRALQYFARRDFRLVDVEDPAPRDDEVKVRVAWCGICGSDVHEFTAGLHGVPTKRPHPRTGRMAPLTGGHEFTGVICGLGAGVAGFAMGDRVAVRPTLPCYQCSYCRQGRLSQCAELATLGVSADGGFAEHVVVRQDCAHQLPDHVGFETGTYAEPLACAIHAVRRSGMAPGAVVAVIGAGTIGLMTLQAASACGASAVYVFETSPRRRALALQLGAAAAFDPLAADPGKALAAATRNRRADVAFECAGVPAALVLADGLTGRGATILTMGMVTEPCTFPFINLFFREKSIVASMGYDNTDYETAVNFLAMERVKTHPLLTTAQISLEHVMEEGFGALTGPQRLEHCKILVAP